ncbi:hypothetical protein RRG08_048104, partial [Elysia crispata]
MTAEKIRFQAGSPPWGPTTAIIGDFRFDEGEATTTPCHCLPGRSSKKSRLPRNSGSSKCGQWGQVLPFLIQSGVNRVRAKSGPLDLLGKGHLRQGNEETQHGCLGKSTATLNVPQSDGNSRLPILNLSVRSLSTFSLGSAKLAENLRELLAQINAPLLFWLDGLSRPSASVCSTVVILHDGLGTGKKSARGFNLALRASCCNRYRRGYRPALGGTLGGAGAGSVWRDYTGRLEKHLSSLEAGLRPSSGLGQRLFSWTSCLNYRWSPVPGGVWSGELGGEFSSTPTTPTPICYHQHSDTTTTTRHQLIGANHSTCIALSKPGCSGRGWVGSRIFAQQKVVDVVSRP